MRLRRSQTARCAAGGLTKSPQSLVVPNLYQELGGPVSHALLGVVDAHVQGKAGTNSHRIPVETCLSSRGESYIMLLPTYYFMVLDCRNSSKAKRAYRGHDGCAGTLCESARRLACISAPNIRSKTTVFLVYQGLQPGSSSPGQDWCRASGCVQAVVLVLPRGKEADASYDGCDDDQVVLGPAAASPHQGNFRSGADGQRGAASGRKDSRADVDSEVGGCLFGRSLLYHTRRLMRHDVLLALGMTSGFALVIIVECAVGWQQSGLVGPDPEPWRLKIACCECSWKCSGRGILLSKEQS